ncbi:MBL fold metallo-hydrolase [Paenibacillus beijingensis]|nr:MBL fold metallo-hydrolase [Paenibacillus beijingensis]
MRIQMVGTGSAFAKRYFNNNALIEGDGCRFMLDCGVTGPTALHKAGITFGELDGLLISHIHADHVGGVEEYAFQMKFIYGRKPLLYVPEPLIETLWENTLRGGLQQEESQTLDSYFQVVPLMEGKETDIGPGISVEMIRTRHMPGKASFSFLLNGRFFYSADMVFDRPLLEQLDERGIEIIFHDCQLHPPGQVHATLEELLTLPERIQEKIRLMHYGDDMEQFIGSTGRMSFVEQNRIYSLD